VERCIDGMPSHVEKEIGEMGGPQAATRHLSTYLRLPDWVATRRGIATRMLGLCGEPAVPTLVRLVEDEHENVRYEAIKALGVAADDRAIGALIELLSDGNVNVRSAACKALQRIGKPAVSSLISALKHEDPRVREMAVEALGWIAAPRAVKPISQATRDNDARVRIRAAWAMSHLGDRATAVRPLGDRQERRETALKLLGGERKRIDQERRRRKDPNWERGVSELIEEMLRRILRKVLRE